MQGLYSSGSESEAGELAARRVLDAHWDGGIPIKPKVFAQIYRIGVVEDQLDDDVSGFIDGWDNRPRIHLNRSHSKVRQRFTLAHEFGHFVGAQIDQTAAQFRSADSSTGIHAEEIYANGFAAELLMPRAALVELIDIGAEVKQLAREFDVSLEAMTRRLESLDLQPRS